MGDEPRSVGGRYDVFISFKNEDASGEKTRDFALAQLVFERLSAQKIAVFFSPRSLEGTGVSDFRKAIDAALEEARILVAVGTSRAHLDAPWVEREWSTFEKEILSRAKPPEAQIFSYIEGMKAADLPLTLRGRQVFMHGREGLDRLVAFIRAALGLRVEPDDPPPPPPKPNVAIWGVAAVVSVVALGVAVRHPWRDEVGRPPSAAPFASPVIDARSADVVAGPRDAAPEGRVAVTEHPRPKPRGSKARPKIWYSEEVAEKMREQLDPVLSKYDCDRVRVNAVVNEGTTAFDASCECRGVDHGSERLGSVSHNAGSQRGAEAAILTKAQAFRPSCGP